jgi:hypothetical protein
MVGLQNDTSAASAVAAARTAFGNVRFPMKRDASLAAMAGTPEDFHFIDKHLFLFLSQRAGIAPNKKGEAKDLAGRLV